MKIELMRLNNDLEGLTNVRTELGDRYFELKNQVANRYEEVSDREIRDLDTRLNIVETYISYVRWKLQELN